MNFLANPVIDSSHKCKIRGPIWIIWVDFPENSGASSWHMKEKLGIKKKQRENIDIMGKARCSGCLYEG